MKLFTLKYLAVLCSGYVVCSFIQRIAKSNLIPGIAKHSNLKIRNSLQGSTSFQIKNIFGNSKTVNWSNFDFITSIILAGYAFETYNEPALGKSVAGMDGTEIIYTSSEFIARTFKGILMVTLERGKVNYEHQKLLELLSTGHLSDPYVTLHLYEMDEGQQERRLVDSGKTKTQRNQQRPEWRETFFLYVRDPELSELEFSVFDEELFDQDQFLGNAFLPITDLLRAATPPDDSGRPLEVSLPIPIYADRSQRSWFVQDEKKRRLRMGTLYATMQFVPVERGETTVRNTTESGDVVKQATVEDVTLPANNPFTFLSDNTATGAGTGGEGRVEWDESDGVDEEVAFVERELDHLKFLPKGCMGGDSSWAPLLGEVLKQAGVAGGQPGSSLELVDSLIAGGMHQICAIDNRATSTQASVWADVSRRRMIVGFRGTEVAIEDLLTDIDLLQQPYFTEYLERGFGDTQHNDVDLSTVSVHRGFFTAYRSIQSALLQQLHYFFQSQPQSEEGNWDIYTTGHSLGGALATLFTFDIARIAAGLVGPVNGSTQTVLEGALFSTRREHVTSEQLQSGRVKFYADRAPFFSHKIPPESFLHPLRRTRLCSYTYGAPRVGNTPFQKLFDSLLERHNGGCYFRVVNQQDVVARMPRGAVMRWLLDYKHVGRTVMMSEAPADERTWAGGPSALWVEGDSEGTCPLRDESFFTDVVGLGDLVPELNLTMPEWESLYEQVVARRSRESGLSAQSMNRPDDFLSYSDLLNATKNAFSAPAGDLSWPDFQTFLRSVNPMRPDQGPGGEQEADFSSLLKTAVGVLAAPATDLLDVGNIAGNFSSMVNNVTQQLTRKDPRGVPNGAASQDQLGELFAAVGNARDQLEGMWQGNKEPPEAEKSIQKQLNATLTRIIENPMQFLSDSLLAERGPLQGEASTAKEKSPFELLQSITQQLSKDRPADPFDSKSQEDGRVDLVGSTSSDLYAAVQEVQLKLSEALNTSSFAFVAGAREQQQSPVPVSPTADSPKVLVTQQVSGSKHPRDDESAQEQMRDMFEAVGRARGELESYLTMANDLWQGKDTPEEVEWTMRQQLNASLTSLSDNPLQLLTDSMMGKATADEGEEDNNPFETLRELTQRLMKQRNLTEAPRQSVRNALPTASELYVTVQEVQTRLSDVLNSSSLAFASGTVTDPQLVAPQQTNSSGSVADFVSQLLFKPKEGPDAIVDAAKAGQEREKALYSEWLWRLVNARSVEREMQLLNSLLQGTAVSHHMEPSYYQAFRKAAQEYLASNGPKKDFS